MLFGVRTKNILRLNTTTCKTKIRHDCLSSMNMQCIRLDLSLGAEMHFSFNINLQLLKLISPVTGTNTHPQKLFLGENLTNYNFARHRFNIPVGVAYF